MMSANAVLMKFFKLPPAVRMMLALLGFGSLAAILFRFMPGIRSTKGLIVMAIIFGVGLVLFLIYWLFRRMFRRKKSAELGTALESQGPSRGDIAEQEKIYREKFNSKLADLKANGLSVYHLPWFVLMGEPGCGKTASLINSGLDFPLGKDEVPGFGGTRNYNWWFSNEAVILDTAGRIAFQEEGTTDKVEWEYFVKLLRRYRPRCPINGVIIAIPADKLLRDSSEERAQKATILRERLRQVHQLLGVRFPTFVLVTKMDLAGGFGEFFEEIRVDLQQRNQMFGWSRSGEFQEAYDPADFLGAFDTLYYRVRDWGMRYLQRKATEEELGLIVTFPESFRQLRDPLNDYVSTIFQKSPLLEPPFFRGFYFTSAVQEGAPIFDVFARSSVGHAIAERPAKAVDSKAFFIHDLYANKVFPEQGLVFRSAKHVTVNKRMRRIVWIGSAAMILIMLMFFGFGYVGVNDLVTGPRQDCEAAHAKIVAGEATFEQLPDNVRLAQNLHGHYQAYSGSVTWLYARMLFIGASIDQPREHVRQLHQRFVLDCILAPVIERVEQGLREVPFADLMPDAHRRYLDALQVYTQWYGEVVQQHDLRQLTETRAEERAAQFETLLAFLEDLDNQTQGNAKAQFQVAMESLSSESRSFAREILDETLGLKEEERSKRCADTICRAIARITDSWLPVTELSADRTDQDVKYWLDFSGKVRDLRQRYQAVLNLIGPFGAQATYSDARKQFLLLAGGAEYLKEEMAAPGGPGTLAEVYFELVDFLDKTRVPQTEEKVIIRFNDLFARLKQQWDRELDPIEGALAKGAPEKKGSVTRVYQALTNGRDKLETSLLVSLAGIRGALGLEGEEEPLDYYVNQMLIDKKEAMPRKPLRKDEEATVSIAKGVLGTDDRLGRFLQDLVEVMGGTEEEEKKLKNFGNWPQLLKDLSAAEPPQAALKAWFNAVERDPGDQAKIEGSGLADRKFWKPVELFDLAQTMWKARTENSLTLLLEWMRTKCEEATRQPELGLAWLVPDYHKPADDLPFERHSFNAPDLVPAADEPEETPEEETEPSDGELRRLGQAPPDREETLAPAIERGGSVALLQQYHKREVLVKVLREYRKVRAALEDYTAGKTVATLLDQAAEVYIDAYFRKWNEIYSEPTLLLDEDTLAFLEKCRDRQLSWPQFVETLSSSEFDIAGALASRLVTLTREGILFDQNLTQGIADDDAIFELINGRLVGLRRNQASLPHKVESMRDPRRLPRDGNPAVVFANRLETAWDQYLHEVKALGPLTGDTSGSSRTPPNLKKLSENIVYGRATKLDFPLIEPLIKIAEYGQRLLVHHLDGQLAVTFEPYNDKYPVVDPDDARDDPRTLERLSKLEVLAPGEFLKLLREVDRFEGRYGELYQTVDPNSRAHATLKKCREWVSFLYGERATDDLQDREPGSLKVALTVARSQEGTNVFSAYNGFTIGLPLLDQDGDRAVGLIRVYPTRLGIPEGKTVVAPGRELDFRWSLFASAKSYPVTSARVFDKAPDALPVLPASITTRWELRRNPWSLLLLIGAKQENELDENRWRIPIKIRVEADGYAETYLYDVFVQFEERHRFPGPIWPLGSAGEPPRMDSASRYLEPPSPGSGRDTRSERRPG